MTKKQKDMPLANDVFSIDAERAVLGSLIIDNDMIIEISQFLKPQHFHLYSHQRIYKAILELSGDGTPPDVVTLIDKLSGGDDPTNYFTTVSELLSDTPTSIHAMHYARIVERDGIRRGLASAADRIKTLLVDPDEFTVSEIVSRAEKYLMDVLAGRGGKQAVLLSDAVDRAFNTIEAVSNGELSIGLMTGVRDLDRMINGLRGGDLLYLAGRPSMGKTALGLYIARHANIDGNGNLNVALFSLEMTDEQIAERFLAMESDVNSMAIRRGELSDDNEFPRLVEAATSLKQTRIYVTDTPGIETSVLRAKAQWIAARAGKLDLIVIDYIQLMSSKKGENRQQEISLISRRLKEIAKEFDVPIIALSQLSRATESRHIKKPMLSDLRESGSLEQDADIVIGIHRDDYYNTDSNMPNVADLIILKNRNGETGEIQVYYKRDVGRFMPLVTSVQHMG